MLVICLDLGQGRVVDHAWLVLVVRGRHLGLLGIPRCQVSAVRCIVVYAIECGIVVGRGGVLVT